DYKKQISAAEKERASLAEEKKNALAALAEVREAQKKELETLRQEFAKAAKARDEAVAKAQELPKLRELGQRLSAEIENLKTAHRKQIDSLTAERQAALKERDEALR